MTTPNPLVIATRNSPLALAQTHLVINTLRELYPNLECQLYPVITDADRWIDRPLQSFGGKSIFVSAVSQALHDGKAHCAVHSLKDCSVYPDPRCTLVAVCPREDPRDAWVSRDGLPFDTQSQDLCVATGSIRRRSLVRLAYPQATIRPCRGNINHRLERFYASDCDGMILAVAGLKRLGLEAHITAALPLNEWVPALGQGVLAVECLDESPYLQMLKALDHTPTRRCVALEQAIGRALKIDCTTPIGVHASESQGQITLSVQLIDGQQQVQCVQHQLANVAHHQLVEAVLRDLRDQNADAIIMRHSQS